MKTKTGLSTHIRASFTHDFCASESCADCHDMLGAFLGGERSGNRKEDRRFFFFLNKGATPLSFFFSRVIFFSLSLSVEKKLDGLSISIMEAAAPSSAVSAANEALQRNDADYFSSLPQPEIEKICKSADEDGR